MTMNSKTCRRGGAPCHCTLGTSKICKGEDEVGLELFPLAKPSIGHNAGSAFDCGGDNLCAGVGCDTHDPARQVHLPENQEERNQMLLFEGFMAYFPNAMAEVAKLSYAATKQHHPDKPMHWDRSKSLDHLNKIARHMIDSGKRDDKGQRHSAALAWRAMANLQEELERDLGLPPSPASKNRPW